MTVDGVSTKAESPMTGKRRQLVVQSHTACQLPLARAGRRYWAVRRRFENSRAKSACLSFGTGGLEWMSSV